MACSLQYAGTVNKRAALDHHTEVCLNTRNCQQCEAKVFCSRNLNEATGKTLFDPMTGDERPQN